MEALNSKHETAAMTDACRISRLAHRIRDMQRLPYVVVTNPHLSDVYELYYAAFDTFRRVKEIRTIDDNDRFCSIINDMLRAHLTVIPKLAMGILECNDLMPTAKLDRFMNTILRSVRLPTHRCKAAKRSG